LSAPDEFYIGWLERAPGGLSRFLRRIVLTLAGTTALVFALAAAVQRPLPTGRFEYGVAREFRGRFEAEPLPHLRLELESADGAQATPSVLLVGRGKHGVPPELSQYDGHRVAFTGSLIFREAISMIEVQGEISDLGAVPRDDAPIGIAEVALEGELVDTKCFLGVMRPATGKVHRACAVRCLAGGVPPGLLVHDEQGGTRVFLLVGSDGGPPPVDLELAGRTIIARGWLELHGGLPVLRVERTSPV